MHLDRAGYTNPFNNPHSSQQTHTYTNKKVIKFNKKKMGSFFFIKLE